MVEVMGSTPAALVYRVLYLLAIEMAEKTWFTFWESSMVAHGIALKVAGGKREVT